MTIRTKQGHVTVRQDDIGTVFKVTFYEGGAVVDLSSASAKTIHFEKPDGTTSSKTASFLTDGTDGILSYTTASGDLNQVGTWKIAGEVTLSGGTWSTETGKFRVEATIA